MLTTRNQFRALALALIVKVGNEGSVLSGAVKEFSTGSLGWYCNGKANVDKTALVCDIFINGQYVSAARHTFSTGSLGWYFNGKVTVTLKDGTEVRCQVGANITLIGSKAGLDGAEDRAQVGINITAIGSKALPGGPVAVAG